MLTIGQTARLLGTTVETLRRWEKSEKLVPLRSEAGHRRYTSEQIEEFRAKESCGEKSHIRMHSNCIKIKTIKKLWNEIFEHFDDEELVNLSMHQTVGYPSISFSLQGKKMSVIRGFDFEADQLLKLTKEDDIIWE